MVSFFAKTDSTHHKFYENALRYQSIRRVNGQLCVTGVAGLLLGSTVGAERQKCSTVVAERRLEFLF